MKIWMINLWSFTDHNNVYDYEKENMYDWSKILIQKSYYLGGYCNCKVKTRLTSAVSM